MPTANKKYDVIVTGELNVDLILNGLPEMPQPGKEIFAQHMTLQMGSSAGIIACNLASLSLNVAFIGKTGKDTYGQFIRTRLREKGVNTDMVLQDIALVTGASIALQHEGDRAMITYAGAMEHLTIADIPFEEFKNARHFHFCAYFFQPRMQESLPLLFRAARAAGCSTSFDMQTDPNDKWEIDYQSILPYVDIFLPNENEILKITKKATTDEAIAEIKKYTKILAVKLGEKGSVLVYDDQKIYQPAYRIANVVDAIGAGDSFDAGFIYQYLNNAPLEDCQQFGNMMGAFSTTAAGGTAAFDGINNLEQYVRQKLGDISTCAT